jgi:hypothetical protein
MNDFGKLSQTLFNRSVKIPLQSYPNYGSLANMVFLQGV